MEEQVTARNSATIFFMWGADIHWKDQKAISSSVYGLVPAGMTRNTEGIAYHTESRTLSRGIFQLWVSPQSRIQTSQSFERKAGRVMLIYETKHTKTNLGSLQKHVYKNDVSDKRDEKEKKPGQAGNGECGHADAMPNPQMLAVAQRRSPTISVFGIT